MARTKVGRKRPPFEMDSSSPEDLGEFLTNYRIYLMENYSDEHADAFIRACSVYCEQFRDADGMIGDYEPIQFINIGRNFGKIVDYRKDEEDDLLIDFIDEMTSPHQQQWVFHNDDTTIDPETDLVLTVPVGITTDELVRNTRLFLLEEGEDYFHQAFVSEGKSILRDGEAFSNQTFI